MIDSICKFDGRWCAIVKCCGNYVYKSYRIDLSSIPELPKYKTVRITNGGGLIEVFRGSNCINFREYVKLVSEFITIEDLQKIIDTHKEINC